jgi:glycosyltransferase involved in cell wall biosynthesis
VRGRERAVTVSVIIPAYNIETYLGPCLDSILGQTYEDFEVLVVDDGSTDATGDVARRYSCDNSRVRYIRVDWGGVAIARNHGIAHAVGEFFCFVDGDDLLHPEALRVLIHAARRYSATAVRARYVRFIDHPPSNRTEVSRLTDGSVMSSNHALREFARGDLPTTVWAWLWHRPVFETVRFPPGRSHEDAILVAQAMTVSPRTVSIPDLVYYYRSRPGSFMQTLHPARLDAIWAHTEICALLYARFKSPAIRARARLRIVAAAVSVARAVMEADLPKSERAAWTARIYGRVPRIAILCACIHPLASPALRVSAILTVYGTTVYTHGWKLLEPVAAWRRRHRLRQQ